jgi:hypothetical protein
MGVETAVQKEGGNLSTPFFPNAWPLYPDPPKVNSLSKMGESRKDSGMDDGRSPSGGADNSMGGKGGMY